MNDQPFDQNNPPYYNDNIKIHFDWSLSDQEEIKTVIIIFISYQAILLFTMRCQAHYSVQVEDH